MPSTSISAKDSIINKQPKVAITSQQSRYAIDCLDAPTTKEILIKDLSISIGQRELFSRTTLHLVEGGKYVLVGRNGEGKSTLLKAIAEKQIPGQPWNLRVLLLGQTRKLGLDEQVGGLSIQEETVLEHVLRSDAVRERYSKEAKLLSDALDAQETDPSTLISAYRKVKHQRLLMKLEEAISFAERRSGARGKNARKVLLDVEDEVKASEESLVEDLSAIDAETLAKETQAAAEILTDAQTALDMMDAAASESRARTVLLGLGFTAEKIDNSMSKLSGGWRTRCDLACALCQTTDVLLLDEPTNFLDLPSIIWLQDYINGDDLKDTTVLTVTHDRDFADAVASELLLLRHQKIEYFKGNLSTYESEKIKKIKWKTTMKEAQEKQEKHMKQSIQNNMKAAKRAGDDKKMKQAVSRQKKLDERSGQQVNEKGHRFKLNRDLGGYHLSNRAGIEIPTFDALPKIKFPSIPPDLKFPGSLVSLERVSFQYGRKAPMTLNEISLTLHPGERYGLAGLNGSGKSTLVHLLDGTTSPTAGSITRHSRVRVARFNQLVVEDLEALGKQNPSLSSLQHLIEFSNNTLKDQEARGILGSLGLQGSLASDIPIAALSGGQKVRLAFAKLVFNPPHLLILDEVTTHLDGETILALIYALREFDGAVLVVTHDRFFMRCVVEGENPAKISSRAALEQQDEQSESEDDEEGESTKGTVWRMFKGGLRLLERGMEEYEEIATRQAGKLVSRGLK